MLIGGAYWVQTTFLTHPPNGTVEVHVGNTLNTYAKIHLLARWLHSNTQRPLLKPSDLDSLWTYSTVVLLFLAENFANFQLDLTQCVVETFAHFPVETFNRREMSHKTNLEFNLCFPEPFNTFLKPFCTFQLSEKLFK